jgi:hypothetical protein
MLRLDREFLAECLELGKTTEEELVIIVQLLFGHEEFLSRTKSIGDDDPASDDPLIDMRQAAGGSFGISRKLAVVVLDISIVKDWLLPVLPVPDFEVGHSVRLEQVQSTGILMDRIVNADLNVPGVVDTG